MNWETSKTLTIAHRGDTKAGIENTLPAFEAALRMGVDGIELDLQMTKDGQIVIFHDDDFQRLAGRPERVDSTNFERLREIRFTDGSVLPTLEELLDLVGDKTLLNLEIKTSHGPWGYGEIFKGALERKLSETLKRAGLDDSILISSFHPLPLWRMKRLAPHLRRGYLFNDKFLLHRLLFIPWIAPFSINARRDGSSEAVVKRVQKDGRRFFVWTVNDEDAMKRFISDGVNGIITDEPQKLLNVIRRESR